MLISTQTEGIGSKLGHDVAVDRIGQAGFDAYDFSMFDISERNPLFGDGWQTYLDTILKAAEPYGVRCNQAHAPFPSLQPDEPIHRVYNERIFDLLVRAIAGAGYLGADAIVVHPVQHCYFLKNQDYLRQANLDFYRSLAPYAKQAGVKIALENMWQWDAQRGYIVDSTCSSPACFCDYLDSLADDCFTACLDLGHCGLCGYEAAEMIRALGRDRLTALHVHDNDHKRDEHVFPYQRKMNWEAICRALGEIDYTGDLTFEADGGFAAYPPALYPDALRLLKKTGEYLVNKIEEYRVS